MEIMIAKTAANRKTEDNSDSISNVALLKRKFMKECANGYVNFYMVDVSLSSRSYTEIVGMPFDYSIL